MENIAPPLPPPPSVLSLSTSDKILTAVRARPLNPGEISTSLNIVQYEESFRNRIGISDPAHQNQGGERYFLFDHVFWSLDSANSSLFSGQKGLICIKRRYFS